MGEPAALLAAVRAPVATVSSRFDPRCNTVGALRLMLAAIVIVGHSWPIASWGADPLQRWDHNQVHIASLGVLGFFTLSGFLITRSAARTSAVRFLWHRGLRLFPAYWACLAVTAFVIAPLAWRSRSGSFDEFTALDPGPVDYLQDNWSTAIGQYGIGPIFRDTPYGQDVGASVFNGSLWSLCYEIFCYLFVLALAVFGAMKGRRWLIGLAAAGVLTAVIWDWAQRDRWGQGSRTLPHFDFPFLGDLYLAQLLPLGLMFAVGAVAAAYPTRFPLDGRVAVLAAVGLVASLRWGCWGVVGLICFAYLLLWLAALKPRAITPIGVKHDLSYGTYLYAFPFQQSFAAGGLHEQGRVIFIGVSTVSALVAGFISWHLIEKHALRQKNLTLRRPTSYSLLRPRVAEPAPETPGEVAEDTCRS